MTFHSLELLTANPTVNLIQQQHDREEDQHRQEKREARLVEQEEADYQRAVANSLGIPFITAAPPQIHSSSSSSKPATPEVVRTIPYQPRKIYAASK